MKHLFDKENFTISFSSKKARHQSYAVAGLLALLFIISSFLFFDALYCFVDAIGSIVSGNMDVALLDLSRTLPVYLCLFMTIWAMLLLHSFFRNAYEERRLRSLKKNAIAILCFAGINVLYILIGRIAGRYLSLVEGSPTSIYPLDALLYSLVFIAVGVLALVYWKKGQERFPYVGPSRGPIVKKGRFGYCFLIAIWMLFAFYGFGGFFTGIFIIDFVHGHAFYGIALLLVFFLNFALFACWEFYYNELKAEKREEYLLPLGLIGLCCSVVIVVLYFVSLSLDLDAPSNMGFGVLPVAFSASVNIATLLVVITPLIVTITATIKGALLRKAKNDAK